MIATMVLAAASVAAPIEIGSVNFVHAYKPEDKATYELHIESEVQGIEVDGEFELTIKSEPEDGKTKASLKFTALDMMGQDMTAEIGSFDYDLDKHGIPTQALDDQMDIIAFVAMLTTFVPAKSLDEGEEFKIKLSDDAFGFEGEGKFVGMRDVDDLSLAFLKCEGTMLIEGEDVFTTIESYYDPATKRIVKGEVIVETPDDTFFITTKLKK